MSRVAITGASGLLGARLTRALREDGIEVVPIPRGSLDLAGAKGVVHLAGEPISQRWTAASKRRILASREQGTRALAEALAAQEEPPRVLVCASAIGFYGDRGDEVLDEGSPRGEGFLAEVCERWEAAAQPARDAGIRVANLRFGIVLAREGGALAPLVRATRLGAGGPVGSGRQWWSWVQADDVVAAIRHALADHDLSGPVNVVAPEPVRNAEFAATLGEVLRRPSALRLPRVAARLALGEMADELLLASQRVAPAKLAARKFEFRHVELEGALRAELEG